MYFLDGQLAQQIVERTMNIIGYNINVMNNHGVILGSGESKRINTIHEGALLAISQQRTVIIDDGTMLNLKGVKSGINQPYIIVARLLVRSVLRGNQMKSNRWPVY